MSNVTHQDVLDRARHLAEQDGRTYASLSLDERGEYGRSARAALGLPIVRAYRVRTSYVPATDTTGSRIRVTVIGHGSRTEGYDYGSSDVHQSALQHLVPVIVGGQVTEAARVRETSRGYAWDVTVHQDA